MVAVLASESARQCGAIELVRETGSKLWVAVWFFRPKILTAGKSQRIYTVHYHRRLDFAGKPCEEMGWEAYQSIQAVIESAKVFLVSKLDPR